MFDNSEYFKKKRLWLTLAQKATWFTSKCLSFPFTELLFHFALWSYSCFHSCPEAPVSTLQIQTHHLPQDCILSLNQFLPCPIISSPENSPVVFLVKKTQAASTRSSIPTFRQRHTRTLRSLPCKVLPTVSQTASRLPLSASTRA